MTAMVWLPTILALAYYNKFMKLLKSITLSLLLSGCASGPFRTGSLDFKWPVHNGRLTQGFKQSHRKHDGIDIAGKKNTPIYAAEAGKVLYAGRDFNGYGKLIIIEHPGDQWASFYGHLNKFKVKVGQRVFKGQRIGLMGKTGRASGIHVHFELRHNLRPVDPLEYLGRSSIAHR